MTNLWDAAKASAISYLGPDNIWLWYSAGLARERDGYALVGYVVVRAGVDLGGHCGRSRSQSTQLSDWTVKKKRGPTSIITGLNQASSISARGISSLQTDDEP